MYVTFSHRKICQINDVNSLSLSYDLHCWLGIKSQLYMSLSLCLSLTLSLSFCDLVYIYIHMTG